MLTAPFTQGSLFEFFAWREENKRGGHKKAAGGDRRRGGKEEEGRCVLRRRVVRRLGALLIHRRAVPLLRWRRLTVSLSLEFGNGVVRRVRGRQDNPSVSYADSSLYTREPFLVLYVGGEWVI